MNTDLDNLLELSDFYILSQRFEEAIKVLKKAEKLKKLEPKIYYNLGIAYEVLSENDLARASFRLALKLKPDYKSAQEHLDRLIEK